MKPAVIVVANLGRETEGALRSIASARGLDFAIHVRTVDPTLWLGFSVADGIPLVLSEGIPSGERRVAGIHLGGSARVELEAKRAELGPDAWISVPAHSDDDVVRARDEGATAVYVSPIFETPGKGPPRGLDAIRRARELAGPMRVYALGGIDVGSAKACIDAGADGVAVIRAVVAARDPTAALRDVSDAVRDRSVDRP